jgi:ATP-binding cassette subfamily B (MDR/TAP) protein 1
MPHYAANPPPPPLPPFPAGGDVVNVLFSALIGGFALGQAAPNLQYFAQGKAAGGRIFQIMQRQPDIDLDADGG